MIQIVAGCVSGGITAALAAIAGGASVAVAVLTGVTSFAGALATASLVPRTREVDQAQREVELTADVQAARSRAPRSVDAIMGLLALTLSLPALTGCGAAALERRAQRRALRPDRAETTLEWSCLTAGGLVTAAPVVADLACERADDETACREAYASSVEGLGVLGAGACAAHQQLASADEAE